MCISQRGVVTMIAWQVRCFSPWHAPEIKIRCGRFQQILASETYVNLTHEFQPAFPAGQDFRMRHARQYTGTKNDQTPRVPVFSPSSSRMSVNWGTDVDPPAHFIKGLCTVDQIDLKEMILPLVVVDVHEEAAKNPDYTLSLERVKKWEKDHGP